MHVAIKPRHRDTLLEEQREAEHTYGYGQLKFLEREQVEALLQTKRYSAGLYDAGSGHLHPLNYTLGLAAAASSAGVVIHERSLVTNISYDQPAVVTTAGGKVRAKFVVLCCNAYLSTLVPALRSRIMPVGTY
ncbi:MAG: FAD-dependent oxidoreductase, partial [Pseudomonadota bacterium]|nr:FAD-dependent oxidoreductase [Pseudomonadota bacterium]